MDQYVRPFSDLTLVVSDLKGEHLSVVGSATQVPLGEASEIDVYVVIRQMTFDSFGLLRKAAESCAYALRLQLGFPWIIETRRGPLKPNPFDGRLGQIHLLIDDLSSLQVMSEVTLLDWHNNGHLLAGLPIDRLRSIGSECTEQQRRQGCLQCTSSRLSGLQVA
jgi:hypothetical protein